MPLNFLGRLLMPRQTDWQRKKQIKTMIWVVVTALVFASCVAAVLLYQNSKK
jgi:surface polysaccharide O-acyltransferase-like enzyme